MLNIGFYHTTRFCKKTAFFQNSVRKCMFWKNGDKLRKKDLTERGFYGMNLSGTRTEQNLLAAFAGESMAANKYDFYSSQAKKEGYEQIGAIFKETADNERQHAKQIFRFLNGIGTTEANLTAGVAGEHEEWTTIYQDMSTIAKDEGYPEIAMFFQNLASVEKEHEARYLKLLDNVKKEIVFSRDGDTIWQCANCGHICIGKKAPDVCPVCDHPQAYFQIKAENF